MILALRVFFSVVLVSMLAVTGWAGSQVPLWAIPASVGGHPWFIATLCDTYWAFFAFYLWLCAKEPSWTARVFWFLAIVLLGNIAIAAYALAVLFRLPTDATVDRLLLRGTPLPVWLPAALVAVFLFVLGCAALV